MAREIRRQYDLLDQAYERQDIDAVLALRSPQFETVGPDGRHNTAAEMAEYTRNWLLQNKPPIVSRFDLLGFTMNGPDEVKVATLQRVSRYREIDGKLRHVEHDVKQDETWVRTPAGWRLRKVENVRDRHRWVDGQPSDQ